MLCIAYEEYSTSNRGVMPQSLCHTVPYHTKMEVLLEISTNTGKKVNRRVMKEGIKLFVCEGSFA